MTRVKEVNGIRFEDVTPSGSDDNDVEGTEEEEEDEYDDDEESSSSNGNGFGPQYNLPANMPASGKTQRIHRVTAHLVDMLCLPNDLTM